MSRKATDLGEIEFSTFQKYISEIKTKYATGTKITAPKYGDELRDKVLIGDYYLEVPDTNLSLPNIQEFIDYAKNNNVTLIFKPE